MAGLWDVAGRLSEGRPSVQHTQTYVAACRVLGYQHPDLTAQPSQVCDWYETEAGLDLRVLDDDGAALWATVTATEQALAAQRAQLAELAAAWRGSGADAAMQFLQRHCDAAAAVVARVRAAAEGYAALRDTLWQLVDGKVATAIAIDDRRLADRPAWLAAAQTVTTGAGDRSADDIISRQVNPYVDNDIRVDWLTAMRSTAASVDASFDAVTDGLAALPDGCFEVVGDLGPTAPTPTAPPAVTPPVVTPPPDAGLTVPAAAPPPPPPPSPSPQPPPPPPAAPLGDGIGLPGGMGDLGGAGGLGGLPGGIGGVVGSIIDGIGSLLGSLADGLGDPALDDAAPDDAFDADDERDDEDGKDEANELVDDADPPDNEDDEDAAAPDETTTATTDVVDTPPAPEDTATPAEPPAAEPVTLEEKAPCEIAADELPQAGQ